MGAIRSRAWISRSGHFEVIEPGGSDTNSGSEEPPAYTLHILVNVELRYFSQKWNLFLRRALSIGASQEQPVRYFLVVCFTATTLMTLDLVSSGLKTFGGLAAVPSRVTVIFKNQVEPTLAQLDIRAAKLDGANDVNSDVGLKPRLTQGI
jgi:hypothetical protein